LQRIVEKDVFDYAGMKSYETQVKDLFAARLCPSLNDDALSETEVKDDMQTKIKHFYRRNSKIKVTVENKTLNDGMNVRYIVFNGHIELQILTLNEYNILETTHKDYEERRSRRSISVQSTDVKVIYFLHVQVLKDSICSCTAIVISHDDHDHRCQMNLINSISIRNIHQC
jgi:hypothetical protein